VRGNRRPLAPGLRSNTPRAGLPTHARAAAAGSRDRMLWPPWPERERAWHARCSATRAGTDGEIPERMPTANDCLKPMPNPSCSASSRACAPPHAETQTHRRRAQSTRPARRAHLPHSVLEALLVVLHPRRLFVAQRHGLAHPLPRPSRVPVVVVGTPQVVATAGPARVVRRANRRRAISVGRSASAGAEDHGRSAHRRSGTCAAAAHRRPRGPTLSPTGRRCPRLSPSLDSVRGPGPVDRKMQAAARFLARAARPSAVPAVRVGVWHCAPGARGLAGRGGGAKKGDDGGLDAILEAASRGELNDISKVTVVHLRAILRTLGMPTSGTRPQLLKRIFELSDAALEDSCARAAAVDGGAAAPAPASKQPSGGKPAPAAGDEAVQTAEAVRPAQAARRVGRRAASVEGRGRGRRRSAEVDSKAEPALPKDLLTGAELRERDREVLCCAAAGGSLRAPQP